MRSPIEYLSPLSINIQWVEKYEINANQNKRRLFGAGPPVYLRDPAQNGVELYRDRPVEEWPRKTGGESAMWTERWDLEGLLATVP